MAKSLEKFLAERAAKLAQESAQPDDPVNKTLDRDFDAQFNLATPSEEVVFIAIKHLRPYANHPFKPYSEERIKSLAESIGRDGLQQPIIIRPLDGTQNYEILAGHNRVTAMRILNRRDISAIIRKLDDDQAALVVVNTNLEQRDKLLPSERAFAYKLQMEALQNGENAIIKNGDLSHDSNVFRDGVQIGHPEKSRNVIANANNVHWHEIQRYIRLTNLLPDLLDILDQEKFPVMAGYEVSFLDADAQLAVLQYFFSETSKDRLTLKSAEVIRAAYESGQPITADSIIKILHKPMKKKGPVTYTFSRKQLLKEYSLPDNFDLTAFVHEKLREAFGGT